MKTNFGANQKESWNSALNPKSWQFVLILVVELSLHWLKTHLGLAVAGRRNTYQSSDSVIGKTSPCQQGQTGHQQDQVANHIHHTVNTELSCEQPADSVLALFSYSSCGMGITSRRGATLCKRRGVRFNS